MVVAAPFLLRSCRSGPMELTAVPDAASHAGGAVAEGGVLVLADLGLGAGLALPSVAAYTPFLVFCC